MKYIDADKLKAEIKRQKHELELSIQSQGDYGQSCHIVAYDNIISIIDSLQEEQPIKVYRVENEKEQKGLWRKFNGTWEPLFDMLTDGQCKDMPMDDSPIYREGGKQWFASAPSKETLQKWFSRKDLEELTAKGFTISEFEVVGHKKISDFEYIFTRDNIINRTYLKVSDIYPQEQPEVDLVAELKHHLATTPKEQLEKEWKELEPWGNIGPTVQEFLYGKQPAMDLEKEIDSIYDKCANQYSFDWNKFARHFYNLGLNARKV